MLSSGKHLKMLKLAQKRRLVDECKNTNGLLRMDTPVLADKRKFSYNSSTQTLDASRRTKMKIRRDNEKEKEK